MGVEWLRNCGGGGAGEGVTAKRKIGPDTYYMCMYVRTAQGRPAQKMQLIPLNPGRTRSLRLEARQQRDDHHAEEEKVREKKRFSNLFR